MSTEDLKKRILALRDKMVTEASDPNKTCDQLRNSCTHYTMIPIVFSNEAIPLLRMTDPLGFQKMLHVAECTRRANNIENHKHTDCAGCVRKIRDQYHTHKKDQCKKLFPNGCYRHELLGDK